MNNFAQVVEIEINTECNLSCSYCPNSKGARIEQGNMSDEVLDKVLGDLKDINYKGKIAFDFYNEPLLANSFHDRVKKIKEFLPETFIELYSNGTKISTQENLNEILGAGVDKIYITKHEAVKKLALEKFYDELDPRTKDKVLLRTYNDLKLTNRGSYLNHIYSGETLTTPCKVPSLVMTITKEGNILPCFEDFEQTQIMGNIMEESIANIWSSDKYTKFRSELMSGNRSLHKICKNCNRVSEKAMEISRDKHLIDDLELEALARVLKSKNFFRYHSEESECAKFEIEFASKLKIPHAYLLSSGTNALIAALKAGGVGPGDEVIIPSYTFVATALAVLNVGAIPIITDIDEKLGMCPIDMENKITENTKAIIPVHMDGVASNIKKILEVTRKRNLILIEDVAQAMGSTLENKYLGTFGDFGCFSLNEDKLLTTGEGGIVICKDPLHYEKIRCIADGGFPFGSDQVNSLKEIKPFAGDSMRVSELTGALGRVQLKKMDKIKSSYQSRKSILVEIFKESKKLKVLCAHNAGEDNSVKIHFKFSNPLVAQEIGKRLRNEKILVYPPFLRRAHVAWQWLDILGDNSEIDTRRNPYKFTDNKYSYNKEDFKKSIQVIMNTLILDIDISLTLEETKDLGERILRVCGE